MIKISVLASIRLYIGTILVKTRDSVSTTKEFSFYIGIGIDIDMIKLNHISIGIGIVMIHSDHIIIGMVLSVEL